MIKVIAKTSLGLLLCASGFYLGYLYLANNYTAFLLIPVVLIILAGFYVLMRAGKSDVTVVKKPVIKETSTNKESLTDTLLKNNELSSKWAKTVEKRDRLKLLEISAASEETTE